MARLIGTASIVLTEMALFRLTQMLRAIESGDLFSSRVVRNFRGFAFWLFVVGFTWAGYWISSRRQREQTSRLRALATRWLSDEPPAVQ